MTKPFSLRELMGRIKVGLRRSSALRLPSCLRFGEVEVDLVARRVVHAGRAVDLTPKEFDILKLLVMRRGHVER